MTIEGIVFVWLIAVLVSGVIGFTLAYWGLLD